MEITVLNSDHAFCCIDAWQLFEHKRVLVYSIPNYINLASINYVLCYLKDQKYRYQAAGIDAIYLVNSLHPLFLMQCRANWQEQGLYDRDMSFLSLMSEVAGKSEDIAYLAEVWYYQFLINDGVVEHFNERPTTSLQDALKAKFKTSEEYRKLLTSNEPQIRNTMKFLSKQLQFPVESVGIHPSLIPYILGMDMWPNKSLDDYLENNKVL